MLCHLEVVAHKVGEGIRPVRSKSKFYHTEKKPQQKQRLDVSSAGLQLETVIGRNATALLSHMLTISLLLPVSVIQAHCVSIWETCSRLAALCDSLLVGLSEERTGPVQSLTLYIQILTFQKKDC